MTIIAWDGKTLAADRRMVWGTTPTEMKKIHKLGDGSLVGKYGDSMGSSRLFDKLFTDPELEKPEGIELDTYGLILVNTKREVFLITGHEVPIRCSDVWAVGSGADYALGAMKAGADARTAVKIACELDINCGNGIDSLEL